VYYSSCYPRELVVTFIKPNWTAAADSSYWRHESGCLDCANWDRNIHNRSALFVPEWESAPQCRNCEQSTWASSTTPASSGSGSGGGFFSEFNAITISVLAAMGVCTLWCLFVIFFFLCACARARRDKARDFAASMRIWTVYNKESAGAGYGGGYGLEGGPGDVTKNPMARRNTKGSNSDEVPPSADAAGALELW
jgi:hypothetical protein